MIVGTCFSLFVMLSSLLQAQTHIKAITGQVFVTHGDAAERVPALVNAPLQTGDRILTALNSRVEVQFDAANTFRLGSNAEIRLLPLASGGYQTELIKGDVSLSTPGIGVDTPSVSVRPSNQGAYRIAINAAGESEITVRTGEVEVFAPSGSKLVGGGQKMIARGSPSDPEFKIMSAVPRWRRAARIFLASVQLGATASSSGSDDKSSAKTAPKPASKTTPPTASNGASKSAPPTRGNFSPAPSTHSAPTSHAAAPSASHSAPASSDHSSSSHSK